MMAGLTEEQKAYGVITASAGNHAQGDAFSLRGLGVKALSLCQPPPPTSKSLRYAASAAKCCSTARTFMKRKPKRFELSQQQGFTWVPPPTIRW
ncbi:hypothetical protein ACLK1T_12015 [Escherichia coli]